MLWITKNMAVLEYSTSVWGRSHISLFDGLLWKIYFRTVHIWIVYGKPILAHSILFMECLWETDGRTFHTCFFKRESHFSTLHIWFLWKTYFSNSILYWLLFPSPGTLGHHPADMFQCRFPLHLKVPQVQLLYSCTCDTFECKGNLHWNMSFRLRVRFSCTLMCFQGSACGKKKSESHVLENSVFDVRRNRNVTPPQIFKVGSGRRVGKTVGNRRDGYSSHPCRTQPWTFAAV